MAPATEVVKEIKKKNIYIYQKRTAVAQFMLHCYISITTSIFFTPYRYNMVLQYKCMIIIYYPADESFIGK